MRVTFKDSYDRETWDRMRSKYTVDSESQCWAWTGADNGHGYGQVSYRGRMRKSHRIAYQLLVGPIPDGLVLDHLCRNRACCNPRHIEPVSQRENLMRGETVCASHAIKTHCINGHAFDEANTYIDREGKRKCRECMNKRKRDSYWAKKRKEVKANG